MGDNTTSQVNIRTCKTKTQDSILVDFMKKNLTMAKGYKKGNKESNNYKWAELLTLLNEAGPPTKSMDQWKRVWCTWKLGIQKKLKKENPGNLNKYEDAVAKMCGFYKNSIKVNRMIDHQSNDGKNLVSSSPKIMEELLKSVEPSTPSRDENNDENEQQSLNNFTMKSHNNKTPLAEWPNKNDISGNYEPMIEITKTLESMRSQQAQHFEKMEAIDMEHLEVTKKLSDNIAKFISKIN
ncbi:uncharacterized protein [Drosophila bipectinata]|uniref:uncharacterized protein isoform X1 n=2 Tax=Drosophila bipectinata TaxID=42026 RepID=UPI0038B34F1A